MSAAQPDIAEQKAQAKLYSDRFREITKGANKVALLWIAALIIIWFTGLEKVRRGATENMNLLQQNNLARQKYENERKQEHRRFEEAVVNVHEVDQMDSDNKRLSEYEKNLAEARLNKNETKIKEYENKVREIKLRNTPLDKLSNEKDRKDAESLQGMERQKRSHYQEDKDFVEKNDQNRQAVEKSSQEQQAAIIKEHQDLKQQRKGVSFDILSQKFEVPPLYAPIIWNIFLIGLILYLARSRLALLTISAKALSHAAANALPAPGGFIGEAPWWLAPLPYLPRQPATNEKQEENLPAPVYAQQFYSLFGWQRIHRIATLLTVIGLLCLVLFQIRIIWVELELSSQLGTMREQAVVPVIMTAILCFTFVSLWLWLRVKYVPEPDPEKPSPNRLAAWQMGLFFIVSGGLALLAVFLLYHPRAGIRYELLLKSSLFYLSFVVAAELLFYCCYKWLRSSSAPVASRPARKTIFSGRRWFLYGAGATAVIGMLGVARALSNVSKKKHRRREHKKGHNRSSESKKRAPKRIAVKLSPGFYLNPKSHIVHYVSASGYIYAVSETRFKTERLKPYAQLSPSLPMQWMSDDEKATAAKRAIEAETQVRENSKKGTTLRAVPTKNVNKPKSLAAAAGSPATISFVETHKLGLLNLNEFKPVKKGSPSGQETGLVSQPEANKLATTPRVNLRDASFAFEQSALAILRGQALSHGDYSRACELLVYAINHDVYMKGKTGQLPSFRLYDLLAGISFRYNQKKYYDEMVRLIRDFNQTNLFQSRLNKWQNTNSSWYRRWSNYQRPIEWAKIKLH